MKQISNYIYIHTHNYNRIVLIVKDLSQNLNIPYWKPKFQEIAILLEKKYSRRATRQNRSGEVFEPGKVVTVSDSDATHRVNR